MKKNKGITLIALIITIVVMLILVAVSVNVLIKSNLIGTAEKAVDKYKTTSEEETNGGTITINGKKYASIEAYIELSSINIPGGTRVTEQTEYKCGDKTAIIPAGFTVSGIDSERTIEGGLVIYDIPEGTTVDWTNPDSVKTAYNQFVWIPVEVTSSDTETNIAAFRRSVWQDNERVADNTQSSTSFPKNTAAWSDFTEPYSYDTNDYDASTGIKTQIANLTKSIYKYGGFYIGRYEAGSETERTSSSGVTTLGIKQDMYPYNFVEWGSSMKLIGATGAVKLSNKLYNTGVYGVKSMLCTGACWDSMLDFIKDSNHSVTDSTTWGNYYASEIFEITRGKYAILNRTNWFLGKFSNVEVESKYSKVKDTSILLTTGATERNCNKNIYDVAGNCWEWTTESDSSVSRIQRGGCYGNSFPASYRQPIPTFNERSQYTSFRPVLYVL